MQVVDARRGCHGGMQQILSAEREWLRSEVQCGLEKTHRLLQELDMKDSADVLNVEVLAGKGSLDFVSGDLNEQSRKIFRSMFTDAEWVELAAVDAALMREDVETLVKLREERLGVLLRSVRTLLSVDDSSPVGEELALEMSGLVGVLNNAVSRNALVVVAPTAVGEIESQSLELEEEEAPQQRGKRGRGAKTAAVEVQEEVAERAKGANKVRTVKPVVQKQGKRGRAMQVEQEEEEEDKEEEQPETSESDIEEAEVEEEEHEVEEVMTVETLLERMRGDQDLVLKLMKLSGQSCAVREFGVPDLAVVSSKLGEELMADGNRLITCLLQHEKVRNEEACQIEHLGRLLGWWRLVERCIHIMSILECLREKQKTVRNGRGKRKQKVPLSRLYEQLVDQIESHGGKFMRWRQALCYDQLGKFLRQYPRFLFQLQVVTIQDWRFWLKKDHGMESKLDDSWKVIPHFGLDEVPEVEGEEQVDGRVCSICDMSKKDEDMRLWTCNECESLFHEQCAQYGKNALCDHVVLLVSSGEEEEFALGAYCPSCLDTLQHSHKDVERAVVEAKTISAFLKDPGCPFALTRIDGDGACIFSILHEFEGGGWSMNEFCGELAKAALAVPEVAGCSAEDRDGLKKLVRAKKKVQLLTQKDHWHHINVQLILFGYVSLFKDVQVKIFQASNGRVFCGESSGIYGDGPRVLSVLQWNSAFYRHYDRLVPK